MSAWRSGPDPVTAVVAFNDLVAIMILAGCRSRSLEVPRDLAVIGVDNLPLGEWSEPPLSTLSIDLSAPAHILADHILAALAEGVRMEAPAIPELSMFRIVERRST